MTAYPHDSLLNLVTVFANETYFFLDIFASEAWSQLKNLETAYLQELASALPETVLQSKADSTVKCYNAGWQRWQKWSAENFGKTELPANHMHVALYLQSLLKDCQQSSKSVSVIISAIYSIRWARQTALMESPTEHSLVKSVLNTSRRILGKPVSPKEPLRLEIIQSIVSYCCESEMSLASIRFLFVLLVGHAGMLRADELLSIRYKDIETSSSNMVIFIPKWKNDQHREGHYSNIKRSSKITCPVSFTEKLLDLLPDQNGSSFSVLRRIVQKRDSKVFHC